MRRSKKRSLAIFAALLATAILLTMITIKANAENIDCRLCHTPSGASDARDFGQYYLNPPDVYPYGNKFHFNHPITRKYPNGFNGSQDYKQPNGQYGGIAFFDKNGNGQPDSDEIQLFAAIDNATGQITDENSDVTIECASCHIEHGSNPAQVSTPGNYYLRMNNGRSQLCLTCHRK